MVSPDAPTESCSRPIPDVSENATVKKRYGEEMVDLFEDERQEQVESGSKLRLIPV